MYETPMPLPNAGFGDWFLASQHVWENNSLVMSLVILVIVDISTGYAKAFVTSTVDSTVGRKGAVTHFTVLILVVIIYPWLEAIGLQKLGDLFLWLWIITYATSIVENLGQMGLPVPKLIRKRLNKLESEINEDEPKDENKESNK